MTPSFQQQGWPAHRTMLMLALPMILANITTPLLGLVDTAVLGHMDSSAQLAGASIGTLILTQIYWVCGFLRMSATGLSAQAKGKVTSAPDAAAKALHQMGALALVLGVALLLLQSPILHTGLWLAAPEPNMAAFSQQYFAVRVWGAPAAMLNLALIGWLVGQQKTRAVLIIQIAGNLVNAVLDIYLVYGLDMGVQAVAFASMAAEYVMCVAGLWVAAKQIAATRIKIEWFNKQELLGALNLNGNMLLRNLALQACLAFLTLQGARLGETQAAVNAILMQFFVLIALGLDGIAYAVEALVGEASGAKNPQALRANTYRGLFWSSVMAGVYAITFAFGGEKIIGALTDIPALQQSAADYLGLMIWLPLLAHWCFLYDGVFVGLTRSKDMRNSMVISAVCVYFPVWYLFSGMGNVALWYALLSFLLARGVTLGWKFYRISRDEKVVF